MIEVSTMENLLSCVESGIAFTIMPCSVVHKKPTDFSVFDLADRYTHTTTTFVRGEDRYVSSALDQLVKLLNQKSITFKDADYATTSQHRITRNIGLFRHYLDRDNSAGCKGAISEGIPPRSTC